MSLSGLKRNVSVSAIGIILGTLQTDAKAEPPWVLQAPGNPSETPFPRYNHAMTYDSCRGVVVLSGGQDNSTSPITYFEDTWEWNGETWALRTTTGPGPHRAHALAFDESRCVTVLFGGNAPAGNYLNDTWEWDGNTWTPRCTSCPPPTRHYAGVTYDSALGAVLLFAGWRPGYLNDLWKWDGITWEPVPTSSPKPSPRSSVAIAYDADRDRTVVFGGAVIPTTCAAGNISDDMWELDTSTSPATWTQIDVPTHPSGRSAPRMVYDSARHVMILFGGTDYCSTLLSDTWEWDGSTWAQVMATGPSPRAKFDMTYDASRREVVLFGGWTGGTSTGVGDTWTYAKRPFECKIAEVSKLLASDGAAYDAFGENIAISGDHIVVGARGHRGVGPESGGTYVFRRVGTTWVEEAQLLPHNAKAGDYLGVSVDIRGDLAVVGAGQLPNGGPGIAYVFRRVEAMWIEVATLVASDGSPGDYFGSPVAIAPTGDRVIVGAPFESQWGYKSGAAYVFEEPVGGWASAAGAISETVKLTASDSSIEHLYPSSIAIDGNRIVIGARNDHQAAYAAGAVYVYDYNGATGEWHEYKLTAPDASPNALFGVSVAMSGQYLAVGAYRDNAAGSRSGSAYVFRHINNGTPLDPSDDNWLQDAKLLASDASAGDEFGVRVALDDRNLVVAAWRDDTMHAESGSAYLFRRDGSVWDEKAKLMPSDGSAYDHFGRFVAVSDDTAVVGAYVDDDNGPNSGSAYVFSIDCNEPPVADAVVEQLTGTGSQAVVRLDGSGSSDPDNLISELTFTWTVDAIVVCDGTDVQCATIEVPLSFGRHDVTLRVTDPYEAYDEVPTQITLDPSQLSVFEIGKVKVEFDHEPARVKIKGQIGLPFGVDYSELVAVASALLDLAGINVLPSTSVEFTVDLDEPEEWKFRDEFGPITKFDIDWKGSRFKFNQDGFPVKLKSQVITTSETVLSLEYEMEDIGGAFSVNFGGVATVEVDVNGLMTAGAGSGVLLDVEEPGEEVALTFPFGLTDTTVITFSGALTGTVIASDHLRSSVGRFRLEAVFDGSLFPNRSATLPRTLDLDITVGAQRYPGQASLGPDDLRVKKDKWQEAKGH